jgi:vacuolar-type H+-ATPase subunit H|tara:strand:+ start:1635 stop:2138 length:504 start_codon:yes stop_codon:yes gene_type:complete
MVDENISLDKVLSGELKLEYIDQLELLKENLSSNSFLNNRSSKKDVLKLVENLIDLMPVELRTARFIVREQELYLNKAREEADEILANADKESAKLISESFVLQEAVVEANALVKQAEQEAILNRASVEDKLDQKLEEIQLKIDELSNILEREKTNLRQPRKITEPE